MWGLGDNVCSARLCEVDNIVHKYFTEIARKDQEEVLGEENGKGSAVAGSERVGVGVGGGVGG